MVRRQVTVPVTVTGSLEWTSDVALAGPGAVAAGPWTISRRDRAPIGRVGPGPGIWSAGAGTRQAQSPGGLTAYCRGDSLLEAAWSRQFIYVYSFMRIRHLVAS